MQRFHDNLNRYWQKFTTMVYDINKSRNLKKKTVHHFWKKNNNLDYDRKENILKHAHHISYKKISFN